MMKPLTAKKTRMACAIALGLVMAGLAAEAGAIKIVKDAGPNDAPNSPLPAFARQAPAAAATQAAKAQPAPDLPKLTAAQIADNNAKARGGLQGWRGVTAMLVKGELEAGGKKDTYLPYTLKTKRPHKQHLEVTFAGETSVQVFDGQQGWTFRPYLGRRDVEPFSPDQVKKSVAQPDIDGYLIDFAAKGTTLALDGTEMVGDRPCYRLKVTTKNGATRRIWVDGKSFLEAMVEDDARHFDGKMRGVQTLLSDYRSVDGLVVPFTSETRIDGERGSHKMTIDKVVFNPKLDDSAFAKPTVTAAPSPQPAAAVPVSLPAKK